MTRPVFLSPRDPAEAWADQYRITMFRPAHLCLRWIGESGRCRRYCEPMGTAFDHPTAWRDEHKRPALILLQPYGFEARYLEISRALIPWPQLFLRFRPEGWHDPKTSIVEIWRDEERTTDCGNKRRPRATIRGLLEQRVSESRIPCESLLRLGR